MKAGSQADARENSGRFRGHMRLPVDEARKPRRQPNAALTRRQDDRGRVYVRHLRPAPYEIKLGGLARPNPKPKTQNSKPTSCVGRAAYFPAGEASFMDSRFLRFSASAWALRSSV